MKKSYIIEVIEPNKELKIDKNWKQKCNFHIELLKIRTKNERDKEIKC